MLTFPFQVAQIDICEQKTSFLFHTKPIILNDLAREHYLFYLQLLIKTKSNRIIEYHFFACLDFKEFQHRDNSLNNP